MKRWNLLLFVLAGLLLASPSLAASVDELERRLDILTQELQTLKNESAVAGDTDYSSSFGLGPAASKVYKLNQGLSIGGYGEAHFTNYTADKGTNTDTADMLRAILYVGYKFSDTIILNTEIELEHGDEVYVEMAALDFLLHDAFNLRAGLLLTPVGLSNELHEPTLFHGNDRPYVERELIPTTWREMGIGAFGQLTEGLEYKLYLMNGLDASGFGSKGIRGGRQKGSKAKAEDWATVARLDWVPTLGVNLGASAYYGDSGQGQEFSGKKANVTTQLYAAHAQIKQAGLEFKTLGSLLKIADSDRLGGVPSRAVGGYAELAYDVLPLFAKGTSQYLAPFARFEKIDYRGSNEDVEVSVAGLSYKPIPNVVIKLDYRDFNHRAKTDGADELNVGFGYIF